MRPEKLGEGQTFSWMGDVGKVEPRWVGWARGNSWRVQKPSFPALAHTTIFFSPQEKVIPSVVIQPASNNEGEGEHEGTVDAEYKEATDDTALPGPTSEMPELASEEQKSARASQPAPSAPSASEAFQEVPPGFLYKVLTFIFAPFFSYFIQCQENTIVKSVTFDGEYSVIKFTLFLIEDSVSV